MWCMYGIFSVKSDFLGSTRARCENTLWCKPRWVALSYGTPYTPYVKAIKRFKNYFDTNSKFPWIRIYPRRGLGANCLDSKLRIPGSTTRTSCCTRKPKPRSSQDLVVELRLQFQGPASVEFYCMRTTSFALRTTTIIIFWCPGHTHGWNRKP